MAAPREISRQVSEKGGGPNGGPAAGEVPSGTRVLEGSGAPRPKIHRKIQVRSHLGGSGEKSDPLRVRVCPAEPSGRLYSVSLEEYFGLERRQCLASTRTRRGGSQFATRKPPRRVRVQRFLGVLLAGVCLDAARVLSNDVVILGGFCGGPVRFL